MRIAKYLARAGVASRRAAEQLVAEGRVKINDELVTLPQTLVEQGDRVFVDDKIVDLKEEHLYYLLNKPPGYISTASDTHNRPTVIDLLKTVKRRVYPVGRLDADTTGVLLLTDDGELAYRLTHPRYKVEKVYRAWVKGIPEPEKLKVLRGGLTVEGEKMSALKVRMLKTELNKNNALLEITLIEGKKRQVKKMCAAIGHPVSSLARESFAGLKADKLAIGSFRRLHPGEIRDLYRLTGLKQG